MSTAFIGVGAMGSAVISGMLRAGTPPQQIRIFDVDSARVADLVAAKEVQAGADPVAVVRGVHTVILAVKPHQVEGVLAEIADALAADVVVVSLAAGVTLQRLSDAANRPLAIVRVMPNTPALIGEGMSAMTANALASSEQISRVEQVLLSCGRVVQVPEKAQNLVTAVSGSGPAYVFYVAESLIEGGVAMGLDRALATELTVQTLRGSALMLDSLDQHPSQLREAVSSPGGTTIAALNELDERAVRAAFIAAQKACAQRAEELS